jgi:hypothetical protein
MTLKSSNAASLSEWISKPITGLTAAGSTQNTAYAIPSGQDESIFTTVAASTGARLPSNGVSPGEEYVVTNHGANALSVYPATGGQIGTLGTNAAYSLAAGKFALFRSLGGGAWSCCP